MARSTGYSAPNPPATRSATTAPRIRMPCRSSSAPASACFRLVWSVSAGGSKDHRPLTVGGPLLLGSTARPPPGRRRLDRPIRPG
jgi:hypothetical protein